MPLASVIVAGKFSVPRGSDTVTVYSLLTSGISAASNESPSATRAMRPAVSLGEDPEAHLGQIHN